MVRPPRFSEKRYISMTLGTLSMIATNHCTMNSMLFDDKTGNGWAFGGTILL